MLLSIRPMLICAGLSLGLASAAYAGHAEARRGADHATPAAHKLSLRSAAAIIQDQETGEILYGKNASTVTPIASITKLMTAMVVLDAGLDLNEDHHHFGRRHGCAARHALAPETRRQPYPRRIAARGADGLGEPRRGSLGAHLSGRHRAFKRAMNHKAQMLGMNGSRFDDATGLSSANVSSAEDLVKLVRAAHQYDLIRSYTTMTGHEVHVAGRPLAYRNTNRLVANGSWNIGLSKTGFTNDAGRCLVLQAKLAERKVIIVLLDSWGKLSRIGDANRIRAWLEANARPQIGAVHKSAQKSRKPAPA